MMGEDTPAASTKPTPVAVPKLRKNKRIEKRWGQRYYTTVKEAVFMLRSSPYMPAEPPPILRSDADDYQPLYVCKQCRDCFRFLNSLESHTSRRSWILGYWCPNCFITDCSHTQNGQFPCFDCQSVATERKTYLKSKGLKKGSKMGLVKIFYNQCQFFAHLKGHNTSIVDVADVMLMPMPLDVEKQHYVELEQFCEIIMEHMFLTCSHIMDWLKTKQLGDKWWTLLRSTSKSDENPLSEILAHRVAHGGKKSEKRIGILSKTSLSSRASPSRSTTSIRKAVSSDIQSSISETIESVVAQSALSDMELLTPEKPKTPTVSALTSITSLQSTESVDNPCTTIDIESVDCSSVAKPNVSQVNIIRPSKEKDERIMNGGISDNSLVSVTPGKVDLQPLHKVPEVSLKIRQNQVRNPAHAAMPNIALIGNDNVFEQKISVKKFACEPVKTGIIPLQKNVPIASSLKPRVINKVVPTPIEPINIKTSLLSGKEVARVVGASKKPILQTSLSALGPRILTVHSGKKTDISQIIGQLPPDLINGSKKIVFIGQDAERLKILPKREPTSNQHIIKLKCETDKTMISPTHLTGVTPTLVSNIESEQSVKIVSNKLQKISSKDIVNPRAQSLSLDGKVIYQNGKKFIIRQAPKSTRGCAVNSSSNLKFQTIAKCVNVSTLSSAKQHPISSFRPIAAKAVKLAVDKIAPLITPSPMTSPDSSSTSSPSLSLSPPLIISKKLEMSQSPALTSKNDNDETTSEKSLDSLNTLEPQSLSVSSSGKTELFNVQDSDAREYFIVKTDAIGRSYVDFRKPKVKPIKMNKGLSWTQIAAKYKQRMLAKLIRLGEEKIRQQIDHLISVNSEFSKTIGISNDPKILKNLKAIKDLENILKEPLLCSEKYQSIDRGPSEHDIKKILLNNREKSKQTICSTCNRPITSNSDIASLLNTTAKDSGNCTCDNYICHICDVFQGNRSRFEAHLNFHAHREPFSCPECFKKFSSFQRMEIHVWTICFHPLARRWFTCKLCQVEGFLDMESLTKHFILVHSKLRIACSECGVFVGTEAGFQKHHKEDHPTKLSTVKPVILAICDIENCVVRLEDCRSHIDDHTGVFKMLYYKCPLCPFLVEETVRGREQIKAHLHSTHSEQLSYLINSEGFPEIMSVKNLQKAKSMTLSEHLDYPMQQVVSKNDSQNECDTPITNLSNKNEDHNENPDTPESVLNETESIVANTIINDSCNESSSEILESTLTEQTENTIGRSICSIYSSDEDSAQPDGSGLTPLEVISAVEKSIEPLNNVITEYSSSPKIFDVRSVTPDAYENLSIESQKTLDTSMEISPTHSPQVKVIGQTENVDSTSILQSTIAPDKCIGLLDSNEKFSRDQVDQKILLSQLKTESVSDDEILLTPPPLYGPQKYRDITSDSDISPIFSGSDSQQSKQFAHDKKKIPSISVLKKRLNTDVESLDPDDAEPQNHLSHLSVHVTSAQATTCASSSTEADTLPLYNVSKPPPLSRIPQRLLNTSPLKIEVEEEEPREIKISTPRSLVKWRRRRKRPWRIAFDIPTQPSEPVDYNCHLCGEFINTSWPIIQNHFNLRHSEDYKLAIVTPRLLRMSNEFISEGYREVLGPRKRKLDGTVSSSKRRRRWNPKKHIEKYPLEYGLCVQQESVQDREGNFVCKKCDQRCNDISSLREHIGTNHRIKDHYLVCLECGQNFVVEPSLRMHLKAFHRIEDPSTYMAENPAYARELLDPRESECKISNQCYVCMAVFEDKLAVDKHLRVHGMAFLNRKRIEAQQAARNPGKKTRIDNPEESETVTITANDEITKNPELENGDSPDRLECHPKKGDDELDISQSSSTLE
ncbi:uncharacterized protein LOC105684674 isoform X2 [Athalia rosae]|uniref:uncharacterized protein LOC105684674 isoform X2 n=1 Tax=Athalia rosae TaxID=37344 RepID=UPI0020337A83|nr:uncharacterized protein LOC105684674 isoform X2 [Athalia rosae]